MPSLNQGTGGQAYWRSLDELAGTPEFKSFVEREFPHLAHELQTPSRRRFLKLMGASLALAGLTGCRWPRETIMPYAKRPEGRIPGKPQFFATAYDLDGSAIGLLAKSFEGRPIKIEGNPDHPASLGATDATTQATVLDVYDPDRSVRPMASNGGTTQVAKTYEDFERFAINHFGQLRQQGGAGLAVLCDASSSPTRAALRQRMQQAFPQSGWYEYAPLSRDASREGTREAFGQPLRPLYDFAKADVIVSFDDDFLMDHPLAIAYARAFAKRRRAEDRTMNRLYVVESFHSITGGMADHRCAVRSADVGLVVAALVKALQERGASMRDLIDAGAAADGVKELADSPFVAMLADDLLKHRGHSILTAGPRQSAAVHTLVHGLNVALGNVNQTVTFVAEPDADRPSHIAALRDLSKRMAAGEISTLLILGGNPVYDAPADLAFGDALKKVKHSIHLSLHNDETSRRCAWHVPRAHFLESWDDARAFDGTYSVVQPLILPLYEGRTASEILGLVLAEEQRSAYQLVRRTFQERFARGDDLELAWRKALNDGLVADTGYEVVRPMLRGLDWAAVGRALRAGWSEKGSGFELVFARDYKLHDGRFANNGWLQELPAPVTKLTWDNAVMMAPADARKLGVKQDDQVEVSVNGRTLTMPVFVLPGQAPGSVTLPLGYGRTAAGRVAEGCGFDVYPLRTSERPNAVLGAAIKPAGAAYALATTQDHGAIESEVGEDAIQRRIPVLVRSGTLEEYKAHPEFAKHVGHSLPLVQLWNDPNPNPEGYAWGMTIDLSACNGCSACVTACQAENNIPVVGKEEVQRGREMHWIRVDRYYKGDPEADSVELAHQPVTCHHCENAPCEQVCPVAATVHDAEGLNVMVYNRCIGTRYCSNNCPYKVRRFNWFYNHHGPYHPRSDEKVTPIEMMVYNPEVTVRSRGVMEKCTFCVQRISEAKIDAKNNRRRVRDGEIVTACQQACPTNAIIFGDLHDTSSNVRKLFDHNRAYAMLEDLNVRPRLRYLARLRNPANDQGGHAGHENPGHEGAGHEDAGHETDKHQGEQHEPAAGHAASPQRMPLT